MQTPTFAVDSELVGHAQALLSQHEKVRLILGGSCTGKSTLCRIISGRRDVEIYDMDAHIYAGYMERYDAERHPANSRWLSAPNPLDWALSLNAAAFDAFNRATTAEYLDLLAEDLDRSGDTPILVDGGFTHPSVLVQVFAPGRMVCIDMASEERVRIWEEAEDRAMMREWIAALPDPDDKWRRFLRCDTQIANTLVEESRFHGIPVILRRESTTAEELAEMAIAAIGL